MRTMTVNKVVTAILVLQILQPFLLFPLPDRPFMIIKIDRIGAKHDKNRSSRLQMFFKTGVLKDFAIFTGKHLGRVLFLMNLQAWRLTALLISTPTLVFSYECFEICKNNLFYRIPFGGCFCKEKTILAISSWLAGNFMEIVLISF